MTADDRDRHDPEALRTLHSLRFRRVANAYPRYVAEAYGLDLARAARDSDADVAATVAAWEKARGLTPRDWVAIGRGERDEGPEVDVP